MRVRVLLWKSVQYDPGVRKADHDLITSIDRLGDSIGFPQKTNRLEVSATNAVASVT